MRERNYFCPGCGKDIKKEEKFCFECKPRKELEHRDISIKFCIMCDKINTETSWARYGSSEEAIRNTVKKGIKSKGYDIIEVTVPEIERKPGLTIQGSAEIIYDEQQFSIPIMMHMTTCTQCSKINDTYLEGIIQLRNCSEKVANHVWDEVERFKDKGVHINKHNEVRGGEDFVFNNKKVMRRIAEKMKKKFKGEMKQAPQHFSQDNQTGKIIYRLNILFRQTDEERDST